MEKIVIVNALGNLSSGRYHRSFGGSDFKSEPKLHSSGRRTSRGIFFTEPAICEILGNVKLNGETYHELRILVGKGQVFDKAHHNAYSNSSLKFYVHPDRIIESDFIKGDIANKISEKVTAYQQKHPTFPTYLYDSGDGTFESGIPYGIALDKMIANDGEELLLEFRGQIYLNPDKLRETLDDKDRGSILALGAKLASLSGLSVTNTDDFIKDKDDLCFNASYVDLYKHITGKIIIKEEDYGSFQQEFEALVNKYHKPLSPTNLDFEDYSRLPEVKLDTHDIQQNMLNRKEDIDATLEQRKGFITGVKYGL
jgi:hypothetical protein